MKPQGASAFSLVELSIVLVILGLLTGGILTGQSLIRAAELQSVSADLQRYQTAVYTFRDKYAALPGDMRNATRFWDPLDGGDGLGSDCVDATSTSKLTCNGDGNGVIDWSYVTGSPEAFHAWVHLANAGLVEGTYTGRRTADPYEMSPGVNIARSKINNAGFALLGHISGTSSSANAWYPIPAGSTFIQFGGKGVLYDNGEPVLKAEEAWNIDTKLDDGKPGTGKVIARYNTGCTNPADGTSQSTAAYELTGSAIACTLVFYLR